jgi:hypothetical protein
MSKFSILFDPGHGYFPLYYRDDLTCSCGAKLAFRKLTVKTPNVQGSWTMMCTAHCPKVQPLVTNIVYKNLPVVGSNRIGIEASTGGWKSRAAKLAALEKSYSYVDEDVPITPDGPCDATVKSYKTTSDTIINESELVFKICRYLFSMLDSYDIEIYSTRDIQRREKIDCYIYAGEVNTDTGITDNVMLNRKISDGSILKKSLYRGEFSPAYTFLLATDGYEFKPNSTYYSYTSSAGYGLDLAVRKGYALHCVQGDDATAVGRPADIVLSIHINAVLTGPNVYVRDNRGTTNLLDNKKYYPLGRDNINAICRAIPNDIASAMMNNVNLVQGEVDEWDIIKRGEKDKNATKWYTELFPAFWAFNATAKTSNGEVQPVNNEAIENVLLLELFSTLHIKDFYYLSDDNALKAIAEGVFKTIINTIAPLFNNIPTESNYYKFSGSGWYNRATGDIFSLYHPHHVYQVKIKNNQILYVNAHILSYLNRLLKDSEFKKLGVDLYVQSESDVRQNLVGNSIIERGQATFMGFKFSREQNSSNIEKTNTVPPGVNNITKNHGSDSFVVMPSAGLNDALFKNKLKVVLNKHNFLLYNDEFFIHTNYFVPWETELQVQQSNFLTYADDPKVVEMCFIYTMNNLFSMLMTKEQLDAERAKFVLPAKKILGK